MQKRSHSVNGHSRSMSESIDWKTSIQLLVCHVCTVHVRVRAPMSAKHKSQREVSWNKY